jgi:hypothetical protein
MKREVTLHALGALALATMLGGCGGGTAAADDAAPSIAAVSAPATSGGGGSNVPWSDPQLAPIAKADIDLYLDVMQAAAERVRHPPAGDLDAIRALKAYNARAAADTEAAAPAQARAEAEQQRLQDEMTAAMQSGDMARLKALAAQQVSETAARQNAIHLATPPDDATYALASDLIDGHADKVIVRERHLDADHWDRIVDVIEEAVPPLDTPVGDCGDADCAPKLTDEQLRREHEHEIGVARNRKILAPYEKQVHLLEAGVREGTS